MSEESLEREIQQMIAQMRSLSASIIKQKEAVSKDMKLKRDAAKDIAQLNSMIAQAKVLAVKISAAQDSLIATKMAAQQVAPTAIQQKASQPASVLGKPGKVESVKSSELINKANYVEQGETKPASVKSFTSQQIEAAGVPPGYLTEREEKESDGSLRCIWHPWRNAYNICKYCGRPFCYEDIIEKDGNPFCLEDVDKSEKPVENKNTSYQYVQVCAGALMMLMFILFVYFGYNQVIYQGSKLFMVLPNVIHGNFSGLIQFENFVNLFPILGAIISLLSFIAGISMLANTTRSFIYSVAINIFSVTAFSYAYLVYIRDYILIIAIISFLALAITILYKEHEFEYVPSDTVNIETYAGADLSNLTSY